MHLFSLVTFSVYFVSVLGAQCPPEWSFFEGSCYGFGESKVSWGDAEEVCRMFGGKLAEIETASENNHLKSMAKSKGDDHYWIGGSDIFREGVWYWMGTQIAISEFTDWADGEPNDYGAHEDCMNMWQDRGYSWNDDSCDTPLNFICETEPGEVSVG